MTSAVPHWKFWHPLPFWQVVVIALVAQLVCIFPLVALRELAHVAAPEWIGSGLAGVLMFVVVRWFARRKLARQGQPG